METFDVVFEAGGAKGVAFIGALEVLLRSGHTTRRLLGTSAGAITATCLAAGYSHQEMLAVAREKHDDKPTFTTFLTPPALDDFPAEMRANSDFNKILQAAVDRALKAEAIDKSMKKLPILGQAAVRGMLGELNKPLSDALLRSRYFVHLFALTETGGLFKDDKFLDWLRDQLRKKHCPETVTFKAFHEKTGRDLSLVAADTSDRELLVLNHRTAPDCPVTAAVRMSMSIPFVWPEVIWRKEWGLYRGRSKAGNFFVDGSVLSNFPLRYLVEPANPDVRAVMGAPPKEKARNLGLLLDETKPVPDAGNAPEPDPTRLSQRVGRLVEAVTGSWDQEIINRFPEEICRIGAKGVNVLEFDMTEDRLETIVNSGRCAMTDYLQKRGLRFR